MNHRGDLAYSIQSFAERGWSAPRVLEPQTALETLWALPVGTIVEAGSGMLWHKVALGMYGWAGTGVAHQCQPDAFLNDTPLTILREPQEQP